MAIEIISADYYYNGKNQLGYPSINVIIVTNSSSYTYILSSSGHLKAEGKATATSITIGVGFNNSNYEYTLDIQVADKNGSTATKSIIIYTYFKEFLLNGYLGDDKNTYMYNCNGKPAPIKAEVWNGFCNAAKDKGLTITRATQGGSMLAAVNDAARQLKVIETSESMKGKTITLKFFEDLVKALNNI